ncbi:30S ribosomal protein S16, chloroplastic [Hondaea fermentalgiana]|uniref:30S ribosomal protein S16, chloroplastic n=1 Tax=Hondaea fermentalgiana TaxID=2315210 RepID=A0A2R5G5S4_9STRA|nr:30S ribosomal protein S16, chloroplastic [Hondaea fermentalgiana]|eukprot:GBG26386.1 30S ribosomal protein S16, chloroplastic [Hondaea fermentalgiana]
MPVKLRLQRFGQRNLPYYRIVAANSRSPRDGKFLQIVGTYNPVPDKNGLKEVRINEKAAKYWLSEGAIPSERVAYLLGEYGLTPRIPQRFSANKILSKKEIKEHGQDPVLICKKLGLL